MPKWWIYLKEKKWKSLIVLACIAFVIWVLSIPFRLIEDAFLEWARGEITERMQSIVGTFIRWGIPVILALISCFVIYRLGQRSQRRGENIGTNVAVINSDFRPRIQIDWENFSGMPDNVVAKAFGMIPETTKLLIHTWLSANSYPIDVKEAWIVIEEKSYPITFNPARISSSQERMLEANIPDGFKNDKFEYYMVVKTQYQESKSNTRIYPSTQLTSDKEDSQSQ